LVFMTPCTDSSQCCTGICLSSKCACLAEGSFGCKKDIECCFGGKCVHLGGIDFQCQIWIYFSFYYISMFDDNGATRWWWYV
jgi:hypothetical protein